jgi:hypothetical protein
MMKYHGNIIISAMILDKKREFDHRTGIRHDSFQEKFFIGSSVVRNSLLVHLL